MLTGKGRYDGRAAVWEGMMDYHKYAKCPYCDKEADFIALKLHLRLECKAFAYCPTTEDAIKAYDEGKDSSMANDMTDDTRRRAWTINKPTEAGWYWWRGNGDLEVLEVWASTYLQVSQVYNEEGFQSMDLDSFVKQYGGEWLGPITPDDGQREYQRGLREAAKMICPYCNDPAWPPMDEIGFHKSPITGTAFRCNSRNALDALAHKAINDTQA